MRLPRLLGLLGVVVVMGALAAQCRPHPLEPARTYAAYEGKARTTAESALAQVETVRLAVRSADKGNAFAPYLGELVGEAEDALGGLDSTFGSIQPPRGKRAEDLRDDVGALLGDAEDHVADVRIAVRQGVERGLGRKATDLDDDSKALRRFLQEHGG
jgi:hypothetical protein